MGVNSRIIHLVEDCRHQIRTRLATTECHGMSYGLSRKTLLTSASIVLLHIPLIGVAFWLHNQLGPGQGIAELPATSLVILLIVTLLPYVTLARLGIGWNPERARLNEPLD